MINKQVLRIKQVQNRLSDNKTHEMNSSRNEPTHMKMDLVTVEARKFGIVEQFLRETSNNNIHQNIEYGLIKLITDHYVSLFYFEIITKHYPNPNVYSEHFLEIAPWGKIQTYDGLSEQFFDMFKQYIIWDDLLYSRTFSVSFIDRHMDFFRQNSLQTHIINTQNIDDHFVRKHQHQFGPIDWRTICNRSILSWKLISELKHKVCWATISFLDDIPIDFIEEHHDLIEWFWITAKQRLPIRLLRKYHRKEGFSWDFVSMYQTLDDSFISDFSEKLVWSELVKHQRLSENILRQFIHKMNWFEIVRFQKIPPSMMIEYGSNEICPWDLSVFWDYVARYQSLSESMIERFIDKFNWFYVFKYQKNLTSEFKKKHLDRLLVHRKP